MKNKLQHIIEIKKATYKFGNQIGFQNINLQLYDNTYCLLGESGSGKTTLAKTIATLYENYEGEIYFKNIKYNLADKKNLKFLRKNIRLIFQSPETTLNPRMSIYKILEEPLKLYFKNLSKDRVYEIIENTLDKVKLGEIKIDYKSKKISQLSGGQKRRVAIARAIISEPKFIIADEPTEGLDVSLQGGIIELFRELNIPMLIITHNYAVAAALANRIGIMYKGEIIEEFSDSILKAKHDYTLSMKNSIEQLEYKKQ